MTISHSLYETEGLGQGQAEWLGCAEGILHEPFLFKGSFHTYFYQGTKNILEDVVLEDAFSDYHAVQE